MIEDSFSLPDAAYVNKFIPKNKFYEKASVSSSLQKDFINKIQKITWKYKLAEETIGISKTDRVVEIQIFEIILKERIIPEKVLKIIDKSIPYQILYCFVYNHDIAYGITLKENNKVENYYFSGWGEGINFDFSGINLESVYQKLVRAFISDTGDQNIAFTEIVDRDKNIKNLEKEIDSLKNKIKNEKQFNRKVGINKVLLALKNKLAKIKGEF